MKENTTDKAIIETLHSEYGIIPRQVKYDEQGNLLILDLSRKEITQVPVELGMLSNLQELWLSRNQLTAIPAELGKLSNLQRFYLQENSLTAIPAELGKLSNLQQLVLSGNQLTVIPAELGKLSNLQRLLLGGNQLTAIPAELGQLSDLRKLWLNRNQLTKLPRELGQLSNLQELLLSENQLTAIPAELGQLSDLRKLWLDRNQLIEIPAELGQLSNLQQLLLSKNQLKKLPLALGNLGKLQRLYTQDNQLTEIPTELGKLNSLRRLWLSRNQLTEVPIELGQLGELQQLYLSGNRLTKVPTELGQLNNLEELWLQENPDLLTPPAEIISQGTQAILAFLQELHGQGILRYEAKLNIVGEGGAGKSSLLRALHSTSFVPDLPTTHGIEVGSLSMPHPSISNCLLTLNTWDFGGQDIYRTTHQFFLTKHSLYLVVWNARLGAEQGRLDYWLSTIRALTPDVPVLLVATHIDERMPDLNIAQYRKNYPQIVEVVHISSKTQEGIQELKEHIGEYAAQLPFMGQPWPQTWIKIEDALVANPAHHIDIAEYIELCTTNGVQVQLAQGTLGNYLHDLGKILYFRDDPILRNIVVLKPNWVTKAISLVLEDEDTRNKQGILEHTELPRIWSVDEQGQRYDSALYPCFLRLMERFDLCYQIESAGSMLPATCSLIPQLLSYQSPSSLPIWSPEEIKSGKVHIEMTYRLDFIPAGIMSWLIVRTHRYTKHLHWRDGAVLTYNNHLARIELFPQQNELFVEVWGIEPRMFLVILKDTVDLILSRFEGLQIKQEVPCICHQLKGVVQACPEVYNYEKQLIKRLNQGIETIQCNESFLNINVRDLLYGLHRSTISQVQGTIDYNKRMIESLDAIQRNDDLLLSQSNLILTRINQLTELQVRQFTRQWNLEMQKMELECPSTFMLVPDSKTAINLKNWMSFDYKLFLMCQHPTGVHCIPGSKGYDLRQSKKWWIAVSPWLKHLITFLKFGVPLAGAALDAFVIDNFYKQIDKQVGLLEKIVEYIPTSEPGETFGLNEVERSSSNHSEQSSGAALRVLHSFLKETDPSMYWDGLQSVFTEDGNIFWLCETHAHPYRIQPLQIR